MKKDAYSLAEIALNKRLYDECCKKAVDFSLVEYLLSKGADPLGPTLKEGVEEHLYGTLLEDADMCSKNLPKLTALFVQYGMNIDAPRVPYDANNGINPLWELSFSCNCNTIKALKTLLDSGLSANSFSEFWTHSANDYAMFCSDCSLDDKTYREGIIWFLKMVMLGATYDNIIRNDKELGKFIRISDNQYDITRFKKWHNYTCDIIAQNASEPRIYQAKILITDKITNQQVWQFIFD